MKKDAIIIVRGGGDLATGTIHRLWSAGLRVLVLETTQPAAIRRQVALCEAVYEGEATVEGLRAVRIEALEQAQSVWAQGAVPVLVDPEGVCIARAKPEVVVDAILAKRNLGTKITDAPIVIGIGPGFCAGKDCHAVIESMRGHTLGRAIYHGAALPNTNVPGLIGGFAGERVLRAPATGVFSAVRKIGDTVKEGDVTGYVAGKPMCCTIGGTLRGLIADGTPVQEGLKCGDVDPRGDADYCRLVSDKALAIGGGVLEALLHLSGKLEEK